MIKSYFLSALFLGLVLNGFSQETPVSGPRTYQGRFYAYWGWNRAWFTDSDIHFQGKDYNFTLAQVQAKDRQTPISLDPYANPVKITYPQTNFRFGYFFKNHWNVSFGTDHMKYVMVQNQVSHITGNIANSGTHYDGTYSNDTISLTKDFLSFEHTNGLNYVNFELRRFDQLLDLNKYRLGKIEINLTEGLGAGGLYPKTNTKLLNYDRYDEFHVAGYGVDALLGINICFWKYFFLQTELKGGYINMPDIRTTSIKDDKASQHFFYTQVNFLLGGNFSF
ncbi:MAG: hypothetical protein WCO63_06480 [Bacteroidota bacterium]